MIPSNRKEIDKYEFSNIQNSNERFSKNSKTTPLNIKTINQGPVKALLSPMARKQNSPLKVEKKNNLLINAVSNSNISSTDALNFYNEAKLYKRTLHQIKSMEKYKDLIMNNNLSTGLRMNYLNKFKFLEVAVIKTVIILLGESSLSKMFRNGKVQQYLMLGEDNFQKFIENCENLKDFVKFMLVDMIEAMEKSQL